MAQGSLDFSPPLPQPRETANPVKRERERLNAAALRVLEYLKLHGSALNHQLATPEVGGLRFGGRLKELRDDGWDIQTELVDRGTFRYTLKGLK